MTVAELHGKISSSGSNLSDRLEDLLTADVFGPLRYLEDGQVVLDILSEARLADSETPCRLGRNPLVNRLRTRRDLRPDVRFWPSLPGSEPDVLYRWDLDGDERFWLMLEVKFMSGKSGEGWSEGEDGEPALSDQLAREYRDLVECLGPNDQGALLYLTAHPTMPVHDLRTSLGAIELDPRVTLYWISWISVWTAVHRLWRDAQAPHVRDLLSDITRLLERKSLAGTRDWGAINGSLAFGPLCYVYDLRGATYDWGVSETVPPVANYVSRRSVMWSWDTRLTTSTDTLTWYGGTGS